MDENEKMLELQRQISDAGSQIEILSEQISENCEISADAQKLISIINEKSSFIMENSNKISYYLEFEN